MANVVLKHLDKKYPNGFHAVRDVNLDIADGEFVVLVGPSRLRQIDDAADGRRPGRSHRRRNLHRRPARERRRARRPRHRHGLSELRPLPAHVGPPEHGVRPEDAPHAAGRDRTPRPRGGRRSSRSSRSSTAARASSPAASGNASRSAGPSSASRRCSCSTSRSRISTPSSACRCGPRSPGSTSGSKPRHLRHARPGRSDDARRADRAHGPRRRPASRHADEHLPAAGQPLRRLVHRQPGDEFHSRADVQGGVFRFAGGGDERSSGRPPARSTSAAQFPTAPAVLGVRPEDLCARATACRWAPLRSTSSNTWATKRWPTSRSPAASTSPACRPTPACKPGDQLPLAIRPGAFHLFADADGRRLN